MFEKGGLTRPRFTDNRDAQGPIGVRQGHELLRLDISPEQDRRYRTSEVVLFCHGRTPCRSSKQNRDHTLIGYNPASSLPSSDEINILYLIIDSEHSSFYNPRH